MNGPDPAGPGPADPSSIVPGPSVPGPSVPGSGVPGSGVPAGHGSALPGTGLPGRAAALYAAGLAASEDGRPALACRRLRAALRLAGEAEPAERARLLVSLAWAESERGRVELGFQLLDEAESLLPAPGRAVLHAQRAVLLRRNGRNDLALPEFDRAVAGLSERDAPLDLVKALNNRSILHLDAGRVGVARDDLLRAMRIAGRHDLTLVAAILRVNVGALDVIAGDLPAALGAFATAWPDYERIAPGRLAALGVERARALVAAGLFGEADRALAVALARAAEQGQDHTRADALQVRAEAALLAGQPAAAGRWAAEARAGFVRRGNPRRAALNDLLTLRAALASAVPATPLSARHPAEGAAGLPDAGGVALPGADGLALSEAGGVALPEGDGFALSEAGGVALPEGDGFALPAAGDVALPEGRGAAMSGALTGAHLEIARRGRRLAGELRRLGLGEDARVATLVTARATLAVEPRAAARTVERNGGPGRLDRLDTRLLWRLTRAELAQAAGEPARAARELAAGMAALHRYRARFGCLDLQTGASAHGRDLAAAGLSGAVASGSAAAVHRWSERARAQALRLPPVRPPDDPATASALEDLRQTRQAMRDAELSGRPVAGLRGRTEALQRQIRESAWSVRGDPAGGDAGVPALAAVRAGLADAVLVAYVNAAGTLHALVADRAKATLHPLGPMAAAEEAVLRLRADLDTVAGRAMPARLATAVAAATRRDARTLQAAVLDPLAARLGDRDLVVVPTGLLMTAPWGMLPACAGRPVTVAPSATAWVAARNRATRRAAVPHDNDAPGTLLVAGPGIVRGAEEIREIAAMRPGSSILTGAAATPAATLAALDGVHLAHLAAHGRHEPENPLFSALDLAGGPLLGYDLPRLARPPAVVVLASCELGLTEVRPGDETFGMASALLAAGTATVVASVGRVADEAATDAMVRFHRALAAGRSPATALAGVAAGTGFVCLGAG